MCAVASLHHEVRSAFDTKSVFLDSKNCSTVTSSLQNPPSHVVLEYPEPYSGFWLGMVWVKGLGG